MQTRKKNMPRWEYALRNRGLTEDEVDKAIKERQIRRDARKLKN